MRMLLRVSILVEEGNKAAKAGNRQAVSPNPHRQNDFTGELRT